MMPALRGRQRVILIPSYYDVFRANVMLAVLVNPVTGLLGCTLGQCFAVPNIE